MFYRSNTHMASLVKNEFFETFKLQSFWLSILGVFPFTFTYEGNQMILKRFSAQSIAAISLFFGTAVLNLRELLYLTYYFPQYFQFDLFMYLSIEIIYTIFMLALPLYLWMKGKLLQRLFNDWFQYQTKFLRVTKEPFIHDTTKKNVRRIFIIFTGVESVIWIYLLFSFMSDKNPKQSTGEKWRIFLDVMRHTGIVFYWYLISLFHRATAESFLRVMELQSNTTKFNHSEFSRLMELWLNLCSLLEHFYSIHSSLFFHHMMFIIVSSTTQLYFGSFSIARIPGAERENGSIAFLIAFYLSVVVPLIIYLYSYGESGHQVEKKIYFDVQEKLLLMNMTRLETDLQQKIWTFLQISELRAPAVCAYKYIKINRRFLTLVVSLTLNTMIVLRQFSFLPQIVNTSNPVVQVTQLETRPRWRADALF